MPKQTAKIYLKVHPQIEHHLVAMCDENLLGTTLYEGDITFDVSEEFYGGELVDVATCFEKLKEATIINMIGEDTVKAAIKAGIVHKNSVLYIQGQPHAQWMRL